MSLWRYSLAALILFTIVAKHALSIRYDGSLLDYVSAIPTALVPLIIAVPLSLRKGKAERENDVTAYTVPTLAGLAFIALLAVTAR